MNLRHIWGDATCGSDLVSDTPTHNAANYGVPAYPLQYMFRKPSRNDELYGLYRREECLCFQTGKIKNGSYFSFRWSEHHSEYNFLIKYIRKNSLLVSEFFFVFMRSIKSKCIINYIFCIEQMRLQITFPPERLHLSHINSSLFGNKPIKYKFRSITIQFYFTVKL
jgi:hypothetical protein